MDCGSHSPGEASGVGYPEVVTPEDVTPTAVSSQCGEPDQSTGLTTVVDDPYAPNTDVRLSDPAPRAQGWRLRTPAQTHRVNFRYTYPKKMQRTTNENWRVKSEQTNRIPDDAIGHQRRYNRNVDYPREYRKYSEKAPVDDRDIKDGEKFKEKPKQLITYPLSFKKLEEFVNASQENCLLKLVKNADAFSLLVDRTDLPHNCICLIMRAMSKLADSCFDQHKLKVLHMVTTNNFMKQLIVFIAQLPLQDEVDKGGAQYFWNSPASFFLDVYKFCDMVLKILPTTAVSTLPKLLKATLHDIPYLRVSEDIQTLYENLDTKLLTIIEDMQKRKQNTEEEPPDNFRHINVFPQPFEIVTRDSPFLRENVIKGAYKNVEHYLDVQYRLVRNDFVKPLRDGICSYLDEDRKEKVENIKIYNGVVFIKEEVCSNGDNGFLIQLPQKKNKSFQLKLENSRVFMYGSLVCFTKDNFKNIIFGRIVDRKIELLKEGRLIISLHSDTEKIDFNTGYTMIESKIYFEPYYYVLSALKKISEENFPMKEYIVDMQPKAGVPNYYLENEVEADEEYRIPIVEGVIYEHNWPTAEILQLNDAQYSAYKNALSSKFAIIQGPPGTGKTHLGLKVAKTLLANVKIWQKDESPMLVICFTNHALDQFLEGLLPATKNVIRIGGQSKSTILNEFNIKSLRDRSWNYAVRDNQIGVKKAAGHLQRSYNLLEASRLYDGIVNIKQFFDEMPELRNTWFYHRSNEEFIKWLLGGTVVRNYKQSDRSDMFPKNEDEDEDAVFQDVFLMFDKEGKQNVDDDILHVEDSWSSVYLITVSDYEHNLDKIVKEVEYLKILEDKADPKEWIKLENRYDETLFAYNYLKEALEWGRKLVNPQLPEYMHQRDWYNPHNMNPEDRWQLYFYWLKMYENQLLTLIPELQDDYQKIYREYEEVKMLADVKLLQTSFVVGMTTTSAARLQPVLGSLRSRVVIVEEAAEIMEAHIITSLTQFCDHVILIGDHQQLRPSTADYLMETKYNLGISLFERMILNKVHCNVLEVQHRMRPEISSLITPTIYPVLHNHESVYDFPSIRGVDRNIYFIDHKNEETIERDESKCNLFEVEYLLNLAQYLILNGYRSQDITILCAYSAQMFKMFHERKNYPQLSNVRICVLDNYQGEESNIILLSLVRNNSEGKIGFLKIENRICVALSRARQGFYIMGNMDMLTQVSPVWQEIKKTLEKQDSLGEALPLRCQLHNNKITLIRAVEDFQKVAEGGCNEICNDLLLCGHNCKIQCHVTNRDHSESHCREKCQNMLCAEEHICPKLCFEQCDPCMVPIERELQCGHKDVYPCFNGNPECQEMISVKLPCDHEIRKRCFVHLIDIVCPYPCDIRVNRCGHACERICHIKKDPDHLQYKCPKKCDKFHLNCKLKIDEHRCKKLCYEDCGNCDILVQKLRSCEHMYSMPCFKNVELIHCSKPCKKLLPCGHKCSQYCSDPCGNCTMTIEKVVPDCGHRIQTYCKDPPTKSQCSSRCILRLSCGHQCENKCKDPCTTGCRGMTPSVIPLACGHLANIPCSLNTEVLITTNISLLKYCKAACEKILKCSHKCSGSCGECYQGRIHKACTSLTCGAKLLCGHKCTAQCGRVCPLCKSSCEFRCPHNKCMKRCDEACIVCQEQCTRRCEHKSCGKKCSEVCSVQPCEERCSKKLKCGHNCIGFCGDPCPPLCKVCDQKELLDESGMAYEDGAKFVVLRDCNHVIESRKMDVWLARNDNEISIKCCPKCNKTLLNTRRYSDYVKTSWKYITNIKNKYRQPLELTIQEGRSYITRLQLCYSKLNSAFPIVRTLCKTYTSQLEPTKVKRRPPLTKLKVEITASKVQILENICTLYNDVYEESDTPSKECLEYLNYLLERLAIVKEQQCMTEQEIDDFEVELKRLRRIIQFSHITLAALEDVTLQQAFHDVHDKIYFVGPYDVKEDDNIKRKLQHLSCPDGTLGLKEGKLQDIARVLGAKLGAWYKCPNGHICALGDRGNSTVENKCRECNEIIKM